MVLVVAQAEVVVAVRVAEVVVLVAVLDPAGLVWLWTQIPALVFRI